VKPSIASLQSYNIYEEKQTEDEHLINSVKVFQCQHPSKWSLVDWGPTPSDPKKRKADLFKFFPPLFGAAHNDDAPADDLVQLPDSDVNKATYK